MCTLTRRQPRGNYALGAKTGRHVAQLGKGTHQQAGIDDEDQAQRDLARDQPAADAT